ncbi:tRNA (adenosine(37)-N6)-threonylcarbamoyltransferase complex ATPase subunit type 1 TsaE [Roseiconus nitratireducens]|uniref:tRNA threonylcarbamoyladenosine biosynthesis protein TsaE n=1 Tax=Roseiconus nitratireducens TaxID=2605748 RepID=A0A5M6D5F9_9BACT|nr:tRNA (adenosine(37)-N6)-threonylcarbamoyltransferase complex ATPase subunit type 1 TsaE [Roseiconus nitratireducens]KAA5542744.1 tRNA (adenosine(37)-N6)-threonylcarbamoyltransferase complex ATPase subunit type 1 TsaE [Roseiconus nitratireducens]
MTTLTLSNIDLARLDKLASAIVAGFPSRAVIGLVGTLGAGKTTFTQALAAAMGIDPEDVTSPTFTLLSSYAARLPSGEIQLHHLDAYRIGDEDEFLELGVEELFEAPRSWTLIEWADRVESVLPTETLWITMEVDPAGGESPARIVTFASEDAVWRPALESLRRDAQSWGAVVR